MDERWLLDFERKIDLLLNRFEIGFQTPQLPEYLRQIAILAQQGHKIEAIELYRRQTGTSLVDAKKFVDGLDTGLPGYERISQKIDLLLNKFEIPFESRPAPEPFYEEIRALILSNKKIEAIKVYREATGTGLKEAKDAVDSIERELKRSR